MATKQKQARTVAVEDIVGNKDIAERYKTTPHAVWNWTQRSDFPAAIATVSGKPVYDFSEVKAWEEKWDRSKGGFHTHQAQKTTPAKKTTAAPSKGAAPKKAAPVKTTAPVAKKAAPRRRPVRPAKAA